MTYNNSLSVDITVDRLFSPLYVGIGTKSMFLLLYADENNSHWNMQLASSYFTFDTCYNISDMLKSFQFSKEDMDFFFYPSPDDMPLSLEQFVH
jgi:hypothetical protein